MPMLPINALHTFHYVAHLGSLTSAATELSVSVSAVSHQIKKLEEFVGLALLVREGRGVRLTEDGKDLQRALSDTFPRIAEAVDLLCRSGQAERLRVHSTPNFAASWLAPRLGRFREKFPRTDIVLFDSAERVDVSRRNEVVIDWGNFKAEPREVAIHTRLSQNEEIFPVCSPQCRPAAGLSGATLLSHQDAGRPWNWPDWPTFFKDSGLSDADVRYGPSMSHRLLLNAARAGEGVILANSTFAHDDLVTGRLVRPVPESVPVDDSYWIIVHRTAFRRPEVRQFIDWLKTEFEAEMERRT